MSETNDNFKPVRNLDEYLSVFRLKRPWAATNESSRFDINKFIVDESKHRSEYEFVNLTPVGRIHSRAFDESHFTKKSILGEILSPSEYSFFIAPINESTSVRNGAIQCFSVHTEEARNFALSMGYCEIKVRHLTAPRQIPPLLVNKISNTDNSDGIDCERIILPKNKNLRIHKNSGENFAVSLVRAFEEFYIYKISDDSQVLEKASPCLKWTKDARKNHGIKSDPFYPWCTSYYAIKFLCNGAKPEEIDLTSNQLKSLATKNNKKNKGQTWYDYLIQELNGNK